MPSKILQPNCSIGLFGGIGKFVRGIRVLSILSFEIETGLAGSQAEKRQKVKIKRQKVMNFIKIYSRKVAKSAKLNPNCYLVSLTFYILHEFIFSFIRVIRVISDKILSEKN